MSAQVFTFVLLGCLAAVHGARLSHPQNTGLVSMEKEGRILYVPTMADVVYAGLMTTWYLISTTWSLVGYKLTAIAIVAKVAIWIAHNCTAAIIGAAVTLAFCKLSGKCSLEYAREYDLPDLAVAARHLADGTAKFTS